MRTLEPNENNSRMRMLNTVGKGRIDLAEHLEETGWVSVYDALTILALEDTKDNHVHLAQLANKHKLQKHRVGIINFFKRIEIVNLNKKEIK